MNLTTTEDHIKSTQMQTARNKLHDSTQLSEWTQSTSNVTSRHRGPKRKLRASYTAPSLQRTSYLRVSLLCEASSIFHRRVRYRALSLHYAHIERSGIILTPSRYLYLISFLSHPHCWASPRRKIA